MIEHDQLWLKKKTVMWRHSSRDTKLLYGTPGNPHCKRKSKTVSVFKHRTANACQLNFCCV